MLIKSERNFKIHLLALALVISTGVYFCISNADWVAIMLTSALVLSLEAINSAIEKVCDEMSTERKESIRNIKDIAAGAVLITALGAIVVACFIFSKYI
ncbi:MAG: diacylglycerol kinase family protein [Crocinitomicaceae bacterium]|nr:diacylglycerol kinase family protein [Crocinitomicaceae bacterium]